MKCMVLTLFSGYTPDPRYDYSRQADLGNDHFEDTKYFSSSNLPELTWAVLHPDKSNTPVQNLLPVNHASETSQNQLSSCS